MNFEKKLIQLFRSFVEKAFVPQIRKCQGSLGEWSKFSALISADNINYSELQLYVDTLPGNGNTLQKPNLFKKRQEGEAVDFGGFNPSKTFGGERNKLNIFQAPEQLNKQPSRDESLRQKSNQNSPGILSGLEKLLKSLEQNQIIIENMNKDSAITNGTNANNVNNNLMNVNTSTTLNTNNGQNKAGNKPGSRQSLTTYGGFQSVQNHNGSGNYSYSGQQSTNQSNPGFYKGHY